MVQGAPLSPILGPLFFLIYINDLPCVSNILKPILFADDSSFFYTYNKNIDPSARINSELNKVVKWLNANKLSLNINKMSRDIDAQLY